MAFESMSIESLRQAIRDADDYMTGLMHCDFHPSELDNCANNIEAWRNELNRRTRSPK